MISIPGIAPGFTRAGSLYVPSEERRVRAAQYLPPRERERRQQECAFSGPLGMGSRAVLGATGEWTPMNLPGVSLWLRADMGVTLGGTLWATGATPPAVTITGSLALAIGFRVEITLAGPRGASAFRYSADNGTTWIAQGLLTAATFACAGAATGITLNFPVGDYATDNVYRGVVQSWADQSSAGHVFQNGGSSTWPPFTAADPNLNGKPALSFTRTGNRLVGGTSLVLGWMGFVCAYPVALFPNIATVLLHGNTDTDAERVLAGNAGTASWRTTAMPGTRYRDGVATDVALTVANAPHVYEFVPTSPPETGVSWHLGCSIGFSSNILGGPVPELVICSSDPSAADKLKWRTYCQQRYGTP